MRSLPFMNNIKNPKQFILNMCMPQNSNPIINQLIDMANKGDVKELETFARNLFKERGQDFDAEFSRFKAQLNR